MIDHSQFNALEQKVSRLLAEIQTLRAQNASLHGEVDRVRSELHETQRELELLRENTHLLTTVQEDNKLLRDHRDKLRDKLQLLLSRVSALRGGLED